VELTQTFQLPELAGRQGIKGTEKPLLTVAHRQGGAFQDHDHRNTKIDGDQDQTGNDRGQDRYGLQRIEKDVANNPYRHQNAQHQRIPDQIFKAFEQKAGDDKAFQPEPGIDLNSLRKLRCLHIP
jgi:hypothetical protein